MTTPDPIINSSGITDYPPGTSLGPRVLQDYEFVWIERGNCTWEVDDTSVDCPPGTVVLCQPGMHDRFRWDPDRSTRHGYVHFEITRPTDYFLPMFRRTSGAEILRPLLRQTAWLAEQESDWLQAHAVEALRQAMYWYIEGFFTRDSIERPREQSPALSRVLRLLGAFWADGLSSPLAVAQLAESAGISRGHLARLCREQLSMSPGTLLRQLRLEHALLLLTRSDLKVQSVSELCGFANPFHFSRCCKQAYGQSPSDIRAAASQGGGRPPSAKPGIRRLYQQYIANPLPAPQAP